MSDTGHTPLDDFDRTHDALGRPVAAVKAAPLFRDASDLRRTSPSLPILVEALERALKLLEPFEDQELSLGLGSDALTPIRAALASIKGGE